MEASGFARLLPVAMLMGVALIPKAADSCCALSPAGEAVTFGGQKNIVIWNEKAGIEHFIREASFRSKSSSFGFIAPTPSVPELAEADPGAFELLASLEPPPPPSLACSPSDSTTAPASGAERKVEVVQEMDVAGYHAQTLKADDAKRLADYLEDHGFATSPDFETWLSHYLAKGWYLTSFQVKPSNEAATIRPVRLSFKTDRPFNPYYVPLNNQGSGEAGPVGDDGLKVYLVSHSKLSAKLGDSAPPVGWDRPRWSVKMSPYHLGRLSDTLKLPLADLSSGAQLAYFRDEQFARNGAEEDIFFKPAKQGSGVLETALLISAFTVLGLAGIWAFSMKRKAPKPG